MLSNLLTIRLPRISNVQQHFDGFLSKPNIHQRVLVLNRPNQHAEYFALRETIMLLVFQTTQQVVVSVRVVADKSLQTENENYRKYFSTPEH